MDFGVLMLSSMDRLGFWRRWGCFDYFGVSRHAPRNVDLASPSSVWALPLCKQARWADAVCVAHASDPAFNERMLSGIDDELGSSRFMDMMSVGNVACTTAIGNVAYMATSSHVPREYRARWASVADRVRGLHTHAYAVHGFKTPPPAYIAIPQNDPKKDGGEEGIDYFAPTLNGWLHPCWVGAYLVYDFLFYAVIVAAVFGLVYAVGLLFYSCAVRIGRVMMRSIS